jgi:hypothetical protein
MLHKGQARSLPAPDFRRIIADREDDRDRGSGALGGEGRLVAAEAHQDCDPPADEIGRHSRQLIDVPLGTAKIQDHICADYESVLGKSLTNRNEAVARLPANRCGTEKTDNRHRLRLGLEVPWNRDATNKCDDAAPTDFAYRHCYQFKKAWPAHERLWPKLKATFNWLII